MKSTRQVCFEFPKWGGARSGSGRKRLAVRPSVPHRTRPEVSSRCPVHVSIRIVEECESLRRRAAYHVVREAIADACEQFSTRIVHFSVMSNHVHLICETLDSKALSRAVKGLCVRLARRLNRLWQRSGAVIEARYHARALKTPREVKNAIAYLLQNARRHGLPYAGPDPCSSGVWFDGWERILNDDPLRTKSPLPLPRTWLLSVGWRRHGPIPLGPSTPSPR